MKDFVYELTKIINAGDWENTVKPVLREYFATNVDEDDRKRLEFFDRFRRIVIIELITRAVIEVGLHRTHEGLNAADNYAMVIKSTNQPDAYNIFGQIRKICIGIPVTGIFNRIEFETPNFTTARGKWQVVVNINAFRSGKVIRVGD